MLPNYFQYYNPVKILSGRMALESVPFEFGLLGVNRPIIITDKGIVQAGLIDIVIKTFGGSNIEIGALYDETPPDSSNHVVNQVAAIYRNTNCDSIIAVGGGSVLDTAKGVNIVVTEETDDLMKFVGADRLNKKLKPLIAIPTTSGTGSEVTLVAVIANVENHCKMLFTSYRLLPDVAILDPRMTMTVPPKITAITGIDTLTHAVEAYSCLQKNPLSDAYAWASIDLVHQYLIRAVDNGRDEDARMGMANASLMAGAAFSNSMVGIVHAVGHACGGVCGIPHGLAMAILLPYGMEFNFTKCAPYYAELLLPLSGAEECLKTPAGKRAERTIMLIRELNNELRKRTGMPISLREVGIKIDQLPEIAETAQGDGALVYNPEESDYLEILALLRRAY